MSTKTKKGVALIVGAGDATGGAIAKRFAKAGFQVVVTRRKIESCLLYTSPSPRD